MTHQVVAGSGASKSSSSDAPMIDSHCIAWYGRSACCQLEAEEFTCKSAAAVLARCAEHLCQLQAQEPSLNNTQQQRSARFSSTGGSGLFRAASLLGGIGSSSGSVKSESGSVGQQRGFRSDAPKGSGSVRGASQEKAAGGPLLQHAYLTNGFPDSYSRSACPSEAGPWLAS